MNEAPPLCWFCETRPPDKDSASKWDMYREFEALLGTAWSYEPATVPVPRCASCKQAHDRRESYVERGWKKGLKVGVWLGLGLCGALLLTALLATRGDVSGDHWASVLGAVFNPSSLLLLAAFVFLFAMLCAVVGGFVGWHAGKSSLPPGVKDQSAATLHPNIKNMEAQGWKLGRMPPRR